MGSPQSIYFREVIVMRYYDEERPRGEPSKIAIVGILIVLIAVAYYTLGATVQKLSEPPKGELVIGMSFPYWPFEYMEGNQMYGFDVDLAKKIGEKTNRRVIIKPFRDFAALIPALGTEKVNMTISAITITPERSQIIAFSDSYFDGAQAVLAKKNSKFKGSGELTAKDFEGVRVGYQEGTTSQGWVEANLLGKVNLAANKSFGDFNAGLQMLQSMDKIDVIIMDEPAANAFAKQSPILKVAGVIQNTQEKYGVAVKKGDPDNLLPKVNEVIKELKSNGEYDRMLQSHFGGAKK